MLQSVLFVIAFGAFLYNLVVFPSIGSKNAIHKITISLYIEVCIGYICAFIFDLFKIKITLGSIGVAYLLLGVVLFTFNRMNGNKLSIKVNKTDIVCTSIVVFLILFTTLWVCGADIDFIFFGTDQMNHFNFAMEVARDGRLPDFSMNFAAYYNGIFIKILWPLLEYTDSYKAFTIADAFSTIMTGMAFYTLLSANSKDERTQKIMPIITALFMVGWPVYCYAFGYFVYWNTGAGLFAVVLFLVDEYRYNKTNILIIIIVLSIISVGVLTSYVTFFPIVIAIIVANMSWMHWKDKKTRFIVIISFVVLALIIIVSIPIIKPLMMELIRKIKIDGGIHKVYYRDFCYFIPLVVIYGLKLYKEKKMDSIFLSFIVTVVMIIAAFIMTVNGMMSPYYYYKFYYLLWIFNWLLTGKIFQYVIDNYKHFLIGYISMLVFMLVYTFSPYEDIVINSGLQIDRIPEFPMYSTIGSLMKHPKVHVEEGKEALEFVSMVPKEILGKLSVLDHESDNEDNELLILLSSFLGIKSIKYYDDATVEQVLHQYNKSDYIAVRKTLENEKAIGIMNDSLINIVETEYANIYMVE